MKLHEVLPLGVSQITDVRGLQVRSCNFDLKDVPKFLDAKHKDEIAIHHIMTEIERFSELLSKTGNKIQAVSLVETKHNVYKLAYVVV